MSEIGLSVWFVVCFVGVVGLASAAIYHGLESLRWWRWRRMTVKWRREMERIGYLPRG